MKTLPLKEKHVNLGATLTSILDWEVPAHYGEPIEEHRAVRRSAGLFDLSFRGSVRVTGEERVKFLQGLLTNDVAALSEGQGMLAAVLNPKGRMLFDLRLYTRRDFFIMDLDREVTDKAVQTLGRYLLRTKARLEDITEQSVRLGIYGPNAGKILQECLGGPLPSAADFSNSVVQRNGKSIDLLRTEVTGEDGYDLLMPSELADTVFNDLIRAGEPLGLKPAGSAALESLRIEAGIPKYGIDMNENTFPPEAGLDQKAISYTKGCYVGQETIARIRTYGHVHRILAGFLIGQPPAGAPGSETLPQNQDKILLEGQEVGFVTSATFSPTLNRPIAMGYMQRKAFKPDLQVTIQASASGSGIEARAVNLPFYTRPTA